MSVILRGDPWGERDRTGGAVDEVFDALRAEFGGLRVERLVTKFPADDNNLWFVFWAANGADIQIATAEGGMPPFLVESDDEQLDTIDPAEVLSVARRWLRTPTRG